MSSARLRDALDQGDVPRTRALLAAEPRLVTELIEAPDIEPTSPLTYVGMARFYGLAEDDRTGELAASLLDAGADKDDETKNGSPMIRAASHGDIDVVRVRHAAAYAQPAIVDLLIAAGARVRSPVRQRPRACWMQQESRCCRSSSAPVRCGLRQ